MRKQEAGVLVDAEQVTGALERVAAGRNRFAATIAGEDGAIVCRKTKRVELFLC